MKKSKLCVIVGLVISLFVMGCGKNQVEENIKQDVTAIEEGSDAMTDISTEITEIIEDEPATTETPGLYDEEGTLLCTWEEFGVDIEIDRSQYVPILGETWVESGKPLTEAYEPYRETAYKVVIPEGIKRIGNFSLSSMEGIEEVVLPNTLKEIGVDGLGGYPNKEILIPKNVEKLSPSFVEHGTIKLDERNPYFEMEDGILYTKGKKAVVKCFDWDRQEIVFPSEVEEIYPGALIVPSTSTSVEKIDLSQTKITKINNYPTEDIYYEHIIMVDSLKELVFPTTLTSISGCIYCPNLEKINIPKNLELAEGSYNWLSNNTHTENLKTAGPEGTGANVEFEEGITRIPDYCLYGIESLNSIVIPETVTDIGSHAFFNAAFYKDAELILPTSLKRIEERAFSLNGFSEIILPEGLEIIGEEAFYIAHGYEQEVFVEIPSSVTEIGKNAFSELHISSYEGIAVDEENNRWGSIE